MPRSARRIAGVKPSGDVGRSDRGHQPGIVAQGVGAERLAHVPVDVYAPWGRMDPGWGGYGPGGRIPSCSTILKGVLFRAIQRHWFPTMFGGCTMHIEGGSSSITKVTEISST